MMDSVLNFVDETIRSRSRLDLEHRSGALAVSLGFRSMIGFEFDAGHASLSDIIDSDPQRRELLRQPVSPTVLRHSATVISRLAERGRVSKFGIEDFHGDQSYIVAAARTDTLSGVLVPMIEHGALIGAVKFCGSFEGNEERMLDLYLVAHMIFASMKKSRKAADVRLLTPRENAVLDLMSKGLTSPEIAEAFGMSERTVNQHAENIATKLRTRNRIHSVAAAIRAGLL